MAADQQGAPAPVTRPRLVERARAIAADAVNTLPVLGRILSELVRVELVDRSVVVAAQSLFALVPLILVTSAFAPAPMRDGLLDQFAGLMAISPSDLGPVHATVSAEQVRAQTGLLGAVIVLISASSFARSLQRLFERVWEQPHVGGITALRRSLGWMVVCVVYLQLLALALSIMTNFPGSSLLRLTGQMVASTLLWWWTARILLQRRVPWSHLFPAALLTGIGIAVLTRGSQLLMPPYVHTNVEQFGSLGLVFAASTWLLAFGGILVVANVLGRVAVEDLGLSRAWQSTARLRAAYRRRAAGEGS